MTCSAPWDAAPCPGEPRRLNLAKYPHKDTVWRASPASSDIKVTITLDADIQAELDRRTPAQNTFLDQAVNDILRRALELPQVDSFKQQCFSMDRPNTDLSKALALAGELDDLETLTRAR